MSKRGSPYSRRILSLATPVACFNDPVLSAYYNKKYKEGKHHLSAVGDVAKKMLCLIHTVIKNNKPYAPIA